MKNFEENFFKENEDDNLEQIKDVKGLEKKLDNIEGKLETLDKKQREMINKTGAKWIGHFYHGIAQARNQKGYFFVNEDGVEIFPGEYFKKTKHFNGKVFHVYIDGQWKYKTMEGDLQEKEEYFSGLKKEIKNKLNLDYIDDFQFDNGIGAENHQLAAIMKGGKWSFVNEEGEMMFKAFVFDKVERFSEMNERYPSWEDLPKEIEDWDILDFEAFTTRVQVDGSIYFIDSRGSFICYNGSAFTKPFDPIKISKKSI